MHIQTSQIPPLAVARVISEYHEPTESIASFVDEPPIIVEDSNITGIFSVEQNCVQYLDADESSRQPASRDNLNLDFSDIGYSFFWKPELRKYDRLARALILLISRPDEEGENFEASILDTISQFRAQIVAWGGLSWNQQTIQEKYQKHAYLMKKVETLLIKKAGQNEQDQILLNIIKKEFQWLKPSNPETLRMLAKEACEHEQYQMALEILDALKLSSLSDKENAELFQAKICARYVEHLGPGQLAKKHFCLTAALKILKHYHNPNDILRKPLLFFQILNLTQKYRLPKIPEWALFRTAELSLEFADTFIDSRYSDLIRSVMKLIFMQATLTHRANAYERIGLKLMEKKDYQMARRMLNHARIAGNSNFSVIASLAYSRHDWRNPNLPRVTNDVFSMYHTCLPLARENCEKAWVYNGLATFCHTLALDTINKKVLRRLQNKALAYYEKAIRLDSRNSLFSLNKVRCLEINKIFTGRYPEIPPPPGIPAVAQLIGYI